MEIIASYNVKGGVGKTTTAVNLAYRSAAEGWPTLLWDLDPQGAATYLLRREVHVEGGAKKLIRGESDVENLVVPTEHPGLDLLPADFSYRRMDVHLHERKNPAKRLMKLMRPLQRRYACLILDCAPGMSLVSENIMHAADALVVPLLPSPLSVRMLEQLLDFVARRNWSDLKILPFFSMVDRRKLLHKETMNALRGRFPLILDTEVPYGSDVREDHVAPCADRVLCARQCRGRCLSRFMARDRCAPARADAPVARGAGRGRRRVAGIARYLASPPGYRSSAFSMSSKSSVDSVGSSCFAMKSASGASIS